MTALYKQVSDQILEQISTGQRKVGDRLPPEAVFAVELGISRSTLRSAFDELESSGVLLRQKRIGTQIIAAEPQPRFLIAGSSTQEMMHFIRDTAMCVEHVSTVQTSDIDVLSEHHREADSWLEVFGSRGTVDELSPICTNRIYVPKRYCAIASDLMESETSVLLAIEHRFGIRVGRIAAISKSIRCPEHDARIMGLEVGVPVLHCIAVIYDQGGELMQVVVSNFDSDRFQVHSDIVIQ